MMQEMYSSCSLRLYSNAITMKAPGTGSRRKPPCNARTKSPNDGSRTRPEIQNPKLQPISPMLALENACACCDTGDSEGQTDYQRAPACLPRRSSLFGSARDGPRTVSDVSTLGRWRPLFRGVAVPTHSLISSVQQQHH
jgi:hypothetical protein